MGLLIGSIVLFVIGCILGKIGTEHFWEVVSGIGIIFATIGFFVIIITGIITISIKANIDTDYENKAHEKQMLEYRIENFEENTVGNELLYSDIVEYNNDLRYCKKWANTFWIGSLYNERIAKLDYIEIE